MAHILLEYTADDQSFARQLAVQLEQRGLRVFPVPDPAFTPVEDAPGIDDGLAGATHVLGIASPQAIQSPHLAERCHRARAQHKRVILVLRQAIELPDSLRDCPVVDFQGPFLFAVEELVKRLEKTGAPTRPLTVEHPPPVANPGLLPIMLPSERCWRDDRLRINYILPILLTQEEIELRLPAFLAEYGFEPVKNTKKGFQARRLRVYHLFDPRCAEHTLTLRRRKGSVQVAYRMTRIQVFHWLPAHYNVLDREAAALYRYLVTGRLTPDLRVPVDRQARRARVLSVSLILSVLAAIVFVLLIVLL